MKLGRKSFSQNVCNFRHKCHNSICMWQMQWSDLFWPVHPHQHNTHCSQNHRCLEVLCRYCSFVILIKSLHNFLCGRSTASVVFIYLAHHTKSLRTPCHLIAISSPAGTQVAKYAVLLFVWSGCSILGVTPSTERSPILSREEITLWRIEEQKCIRVAVPTLAKFSSW